MFSNTAPYGQEREGKLATQPLRTYGAVFGEHPLAVPSMQLKKHLSQVTYWWTFWHGVTAMHRLAATVYSTCVHSSTVVEMRWLMCIYFGRITSVLSYILCSIGRTLPRSLPILRNRMDLQSTQAFYLLVNGKNMSGLSTSMGQIYNTEKDLDGFLYMVYASQEFFGWFTPSVPLILYAPVRTLALDTHCNIYLHFFCTFINPFLCVFTLGAV